MFLISKNQISAQFSLLLLRLHICLLFLESVTVEMKKYSEYLYKLIAFLYSSGNALPFPITSTNINRAIKRDKGLNSSKTRMWSRKQAFLYNVSKNGPLCARTLFHFSGGNSIHLLNLQYCANKILPSIIFTSISYLPYCKLLKDSAFFYLFSWKEIFVQSKILLEGKNNVGLFYKYTEWFDLKSTINSVSPDIFLYIQLLEIYSEERYLHI